MPDCFFNFWTKECKILFAFTIMICQNLNKLVNFRFSEKINEIGLVITKVSIKYSCTQDFLLTFTIEKPVDLNLAGKC